MEFSEQPGKIRKRAGKETHKSSSDCRILPDDHTVTYCAISSNELSSKLRKLGKAHCADQAIPPDATKCKAAYLVALAVVENEFTWWMVLEMV